MNIPLDVRAPGIFFLARTSSVVAFTSILHVALARMLAEEIQCYVNNITSVICWMPSLLGPVTSRSVVSSLIKALTSTITQEPLIPQYFSA